MNIPPPESLPRRRGRPASGSEEAPERILDRAAELFARAGYDGATTRELAAAAGVNVSTLAWHFGDKQGLYAAVIDRVYARLLAVDLALDHLPADRPGRVRALVDRLYRLARRHRSEVRMLLRHVLDTTRMPAHVRDRWLGPVLARAAEALAALDLPPGDHRLALLSLNHLLARYAVSEDADLAPFLELDSADDAVARHLGEVACRLLGV